MASFEHHSFTGQTAYHDLIRLLKDAAVSALRGKPTLRSRGLQKYWYDLHRIGEDTPDLRDRLDQQNDLRRAEKERQQAQSSLIRILRAEGYRTSDPATGRLIAAFGSAGVFRLGGTLIGTHAFRLYEAELSVRMPFDHLAATGDIDIASRERLPLALADAAYPAIAEVLDGFAFDAVPGLDRNMIWKWRQVRSNSLGEFLTPSFREDEDVRKPEAIGVHARALHFLNYLIAEPIPAAVLYRFGVQVQIPQPGQHVAQAVQCQP